MTTEHPPNNGWSIVIDWPDPESLPWVYGPYDHEPTQVEQAAARSDFQKNSTTTDNDWDEYGCTLQLCPLLSVDPPQEEA